MAMPTVTDLNFDKHYYYPLIISMNRYNGSCNTMEDPFGRICVPNETGHMMIASVTRDKNGTMLSINVTVKKPLRHSAWE